MNKAFKTEASKKNLGSIKDYAEQAQALQMESRKLYYNNENQTAVPKRMYHIPKKAIVATTDTSTSTIVAKVAKIETANIHAHQADSQAANRENFDLIDVHIQDKSVNENVIDAEADAAIFPIVEKLID